MIVTSNNPRHKKLGKKLEVSVRRMALLSQYVQTQRTASGKLAAILEDYEENADVFGDLKEEVETMELALSMLRTSLTSASALFEKYREHFEKLDRDVEKLVKKTVEKDLAKPPPGVPPLQPMSKA